MESFGPGGRNYREGFLTQRGLSQGTCLHRSLRKLSEGCPGGKRKSPRSWGIRQANTVGPGQVPQGGRTRASAEPALRERAGALEEPGLTAGSAQPELWRMETRTGGFEGEDSPLHRTLPPKGQRPREEDRVGGRWYLTGREGEDLEGEENGQCERRKGEENTDVDTETQIERNPKAETDSKLCSGAGGL